MKNFVQQGETLTVVAPYAVSAGQGVLVGSLFGIAVNDALIGASVEIRTEGVYEVAKTSALAIAQGDALFWDDVLKVVNKTSTGVPVGMAIASGGMPAPFISTGLFHSGTQAVKIPQVGGDSVPVGQLCLSRMQRTFDATGNVNISFWLFVPAVQTNPIGVRDTDIIHFGLGAYPSTVPQCGMSLSPTAKLQITVWDIPVAVAIGVLPTEAWHFIEFTALIADVAGTAQVKADGAVVCSFAGRTTAGSSSVASPGETVDTYQFGAASWSADTLAQPWLYEYWLDDVNIAGDITPNYGEFRVTSWRLNKDYSIDLEGRTTTDEMYDMVAGNKPADVHVDPIPDEPLSPQIASDLTLLSQSNGDLFVTVKAIDSPDFPVSKYKGFELFVIVDLESQRTGATTALAANQLIGDVTLQLASVAGLKVGDPINVGLEVETITGPGTMGDTPSSTTVTVARGQSLSVAAAHTLGDPVYRVTGIAPFTYMFPDGYIDSQALLTSGGVNYKLLQGTLQPKRMRIIYANVKLLSEHSPSDVFEKSFAISPGSPSAEDNVFGALPGIQTYDGLSDSISVNGPLEVGDDVADDLQFDPGTVLGVSVATVSAAPAVTAIQFRVDTVNPDGSITMGGVSGIPVGALSSGSISSGAAGGVMDGLKFRLVVTQIGSADNPGINFTIVFPY